MSQSWKAYFPDDGGTAEDAISLNAYDADDAAKRAVEYDWSKHDGWERGENEFTVMIISPSGVEFKYTGWNEPDVNHCVRRARP